MPFDLGDTVRLTAECRDPGGALSNAVGAVLTVTLPDGTTATPAVTNPPGQTGLYTVDYPTVQAGLHGVRWLFTSPGCAYTDALDVREAGPPLLFSLADAKRKVGIAPGETRYDDELRIVIEATTKCVEYFVGAIVRRTVSEIAHGGSDRMLLQVTPVLSVISITGVQPWQLEIPTAAVDVDPVTGVLRRNDWLMFWRGPYRVVYTVGRPSVTANVSLAARIILQHLNRTMYGASRGLPALGGGEDFSVTEPIPGLGYAIPNRALQLLQGDLQPEGIA